MAFIGSQIDVEFEAWRSYRCGGRTARRHRDQIRSRFGFRGWSDAEIGRLVVAVSEFVARWGDGRHGASDAALGWFRRSRVEAPAFGRLEPLVASAIRRWEESIIDDLAGRFDASVVEAVETLVAGFESESGPNLRARPGPVGVQTATSQIRATNPLVDEFEAQHKAFNGALSAVLAEPPVVEASRDWARCMAETKRFYETQHEILEDVYAQRRKLLESLFVELENTVPVVAERYEILSDPSRLPQDFLSEVDAFKEWEIELAVADVECYMSHVEPVMGPRVLALENTVFG